MTPRALTVDEKTSWGVPLRALSRTFFILPTVFVGVPYTSNKVEGTENTCPHPCLF